MSHVPKVVSLVATVLLVFVGGVSLAGPPDPTKPMALMLPDLVPWVPPVYGGKIGVMYFSCEMWPFGVRVLPTMLAIKNIGTAATIVSVKIHVKIDGRDWSEPLIFQVGAGLDPGHMQAFAPRALGAVGPGTHTLWMKVDSENAQAELNENNNEATATTTCP